MVISGGRLPPGIKRKDPPWSAGLALDPCGRLYQHGDPGAASDGGRRATGASMSSSREPSPGDAASARAPIDSPLAGMLDWDNPFRHGFVAGSDWAPWLASAGYPPTGPAGLQANPPVRTVKPPDPPAPSGSDQEYDRYRRDYEARLDDAYAQWKRSFFGSLFEPWILDRRAVEAVRKLGGGASA
jgi:hypothetical protein